MELTSNEGSKGDVAATISRLEACIVWRRTERIDELDRMADDCEPEVCLLSNRLTSLSMSWSSCAVQSRTGKNIVLGFTIKAQPVIYFFPNRNTTPPERRRPIHAVSYNSQHPKSSYVSCRADFHAREGKGSHAPECHVRLPRFRTSVCS